MLITFEGIDGSGKTTQFNRLCRHLTESGLEYKAVSFPRYESPSGTLIRLYLSGAFGTADEVNAYAASSFYAADRYASYKTEWANLYNSGVTVICDRYIGSNAIHQGAKMKSMSELSAFCAWISEYEYNLLELPKPDLTLYFRIDPATAAKRILKRGTSRDIHERDSGYLNRCAESAEFSAEYFGWKTIDAAADEDSVFLEILKYI